VVGSTPRRLPEIGSRFFALPLGNIIQTMTAGFQCAGCGEWNETNVDSSAGMRQEYIEDCQVCCKPNVLRVNWDMSAAEYTISAELE
jgi:hypothetical protein